MAIDRQLWQLDVSENFDKEYPCPRCAKGKVSRGIRPVTLVEPWHSLDEHSHEDWEPDWDQISFTTMLTCDDVSCGEVVAVSGRATNSYFERYTEDGEPIDQVYLTSLRPVSMYPAPPLFPISKTFPPKVQHELRLAFQLYWADRSASTSRLRTSLERVLDERGIPTLLLSKNGKGKAKRLTLFDRIERFEKKTEDADSTESMNALRVVGNLGTHGDEVTEGDYFDLLDVYEDALLDIYELKKIKLKAKKKSLLDLK